MDKKVAKLATKAKLKAEQNKIQAFDSSYTAEKSHFKKDENQNYLVFQAIQVILIKIF